MEDSDSTIDLLSEVDKLMDVSGESADSRSDIEQINVGLTKRHDSILFIS